MSSKALIVAQLRRMIAEADDKTYSDEALEVILEDYPIKDQNGVAPMVLENGAYEFDDDWVPTYDLNAAAAQIWLEKAAAVADQYSEEILSGTASLYKVKGDQHKQAMKMHRRFASMRKSKSRRMLAAIQIVDN